MRPIALGALAALVGGAALVIDAVLHGRASLLLVVIVPVFSGSSVEFLLGVVLLVVGFFLVPLTVWEPSDHEPLSPPAERPAVPPPRTGVAGGGLVLVGPVPIFFGAWKNGSRRVRLLAALVGAALLVLLVVGFLVAVR
jgi:uncharacterized protein (TIGR00304 family)